MNMSGPTHEQMPAAIFMLVGREFTPFTCAMRTVASDQAHCAGRSEAAIMTCLLICPITNCHELQCQ